MKQVKKLNKYDETRLAEIKYGLESFYLTVTKLIIIFILTFILGTTKYTLLFLAFNVPIRTISFGFHANSSFQCLIMSTLIFLFLPLLAKILILPKLAICLIYFCLMIGFFIMSPKDSIKKPLRNNKKRFWLKIASVVLVSIYFIISLFIKNNLIINSMLLALIFQLMMICPIPYLIFKQKYNFKWFK